MQFFSGCSKVLFIILSWECILVWSVCIEDTLHVKHTQSNYQRVPLLLLLVVIKGKLGVPKKNREYIESRNIIDCEDLISSGLEPGIVFTIFVSPWLWRGTKSGRTVTQLVNFVRIESVLILRNSESKVARYTNSPTCLIHYIRTSFNLKFWDLFYFLVAQLTKFQSRNNIWRCQNWKIWIGDNHTSFEGR